MVGMVPYLFITRPDLGQFCLDLHALSSLIYGLSILACLHPVVLLYLLEKYYFHKVFYYYPRKIKNSKKMNKRIRRGEIE